MIKCEIDGKEFKNGGVLARHLKKVMTLDDYEKLEEFDRKKDVSDRVVQYHIVNKVSGVTLCEECHKKLHPSLNL